MGVAGGERPSTVVDERASGAAPLASPEAAQVWADLTRMASGEAPTMGLAAGERPGADVEVLCSALAVAEYELARRMVAAARSGSLSLVGEGAMLLARGWSSGWARRLARSGEFVRAHPALRDAWASGVITSEHVHALARRADCLSVEEMAAVVAELSALWGQLSPQAVAAFVARVVAVLHPPSDPEPAEAAAHESRSLSFARASDSVVLSGCLPRIEGELVIAAIEAFAERLRSEADHVPPAARRADGLVALVNAAHASGSIPTRGGLPVSVSVVVESTAAGDQTWSTSRGHVLTAAEQRFAGCDAQVTPVLIESSECPDTAEQIVEATGTPDPNGGAAPRITALAAALLGTRIPLAVGRTARTATASQRRALAARDRGCVIPGCGVPAEACQTHHVVDWAAGGRTDLANLALLCWSHHRQVDLRMWTIAPFTAGHVDEPRPGAPPGTPWPGNNGSPWWITRTPRTRWRL